MADLSRRCAGLSTLPCADPRFRRNARKDPIPQRSINSFVPGVCSTLGFQGGAEKKVEGESVYYARSSGARYNRVW